MVDRESATNESPLGAVSTRRLEGKIVETTYRGKISAEMAEQVRRDIEPFLKDTPGVDWLINTTAATGFAPAPRTATIGVIELFKKHKGHRIAAVMPSTGIRMVASALVFATGMPLKIFETRDKALAYLRSKDP